VVVYGTTIKIPGKYQLKVFLLECFITNKLFGGKGDVITHNEEERRVCIV
jgi:hypothetical protein